MAYIKYVCILTNGKKYDIKLRIYYFNTRKTPQHINAEGRVKIEKTLARLNARGWCQTTLNEKCEPIKV